MYFISMRLIAIFVLAASIVILSGAASSVLAVAQNYASTGGCCPVEQTGGQDDSACCVSPECQCLSCLTVDLQQTSLSLAGTAESDCTHLEETAALTGGNYRTIDYPPEIV